MLHADGLIYFVLMAPTFVPFCCMCTHAVANFDVMYIYMMQFLSVLLIFLSKRQRFAMLHAKSLFKLVDDIKDEIYNFLHMTNYWVKYYNLSIILYLVRYYK